MQNRLATLIWDPHQGLWNHDLVWRVRRLPGGKVIAYGLHVLDSWLLICRAVRRRVRVAGMGSIAGAGSLPARGVYVDCGLHKTGHQIALMSDWFLGRTDFEIIGFEASPVHMADACRALADIPRLSLQQVALVGPDYAGGLVKLYRDTDTGLGDSLFIGRGSVYDDVPAIRLTAFLSDVGIDPRTVPVILRMNIEGAEKYVIEDLVEAGIHDEIAGYYGMWDDLAKLDPGLDTHFCALLRQSGIKPFTFNDRDSSSKLRLWAIRYDIETTLCNFQRRIITDYGGKLLK